MSRAVKDGTLIYRITASERFGHFIMAIIILAGILVGLETWQWLVEHYGRVLFAADAIIVGIFTLEIAIKIWTGFHYGEEGERCVLPVPDEELPLSFELSYRERFGRWRRIRTESLRIFFHEPWNIFDFVIILAAFVPLFGAGAIYLRLARIFRIMRLIRIIPTLPQAHVATVWGARKAFVYIAFLLSLLFYMYAVAGVFLFRENDPVHFGDLRHALISLFRIVTLEDWTDIMYTQMYGCDVFNYGTLEYLCTAPKEMPFIAPLYFISFILLGTMIFLNMFVGIIVTAMDDATRTARQDELRETLQKVLREMGEDESTLDVKRELFDLDAQLAIVEDKLKGIRQVTSRIRETHGDPPDTDGDPDPPSQTSEP